MRLNFVVSFYNVSTRRILKICIFLGQKTYWFHHFNKNVLLLIDCGIKRAGNELLQLSTSCTFCSDCTSDMSLTVNLFIFFAILYFGVNFYVKVIYIKIRRAVLSQKCC